MTDDTNFTPMFGSCTSPRAEIAYGTDVAKKHTTTKTGRIWPLVCGGKNRVFSPPIPYYIMQRIWVVMQATSVSSRCVKSAMRKIYDSKRYVPILNGCHLPVIRVDVNSEKHQPYQSQQGLFVCATGEKITPALWVNNCWPHPAIIAPFSFHQRKQQISLETS